MAADNYIDPEELKDLNGVIEPLTIRAGIATVDVDPVVIIHTIRGEVGSGNPDSVDRSDMVSSVQEFDPTYKQTPFVEPPCTYIGVSTTVGRTSPTIVDDGGAPIIPFDDQHALRGLIIDSESSHLRSATGGLDDLDPGTENYIPPDQVSSRCGFMLWQDATPYGTDSIAFAGFMGDYGHIYSGSL